MTTVKVEIQAHQHSDAVQKLRDVLNMVEQGFTGDANTCGKGCYRFSIEGPETHSDNPDDYEPKELVHSAS